MTTEAPIRTSNAPRRLSMKASGEMSRTLDVLRDGPATTAEVGAELGIAPKLASARLYDLLRRGKVTKQPWGVCTGGRPGSMWSIVEGV